KIFNASPGFGQQMTLEETQRFLISDVRNIYLGTLDDKSEPNIHPAWFYYDNQKNMIYVETAKSSKKIQNLNQKNLIYFCIDDSTPPYRGVRGKGKTKISTDVDFNYFIAEKIMIKYLGNLDHPMASVLLENVRKGESVLIEISPKYFSTWNYGK
ncbi:MAG: pyridoxamine 5'-phosphate oxidase, partial [Nitrososphaeraceae archaeon]|nr:pyridoxamine 5'-phosphate oxidase [Nitrososphaeraceae archaeon]